MYIFNDWHAVMALGLAGRHDHAEHVLTANRRLAAGTNRDAARAGRADAAGGVQRVRRRAPADTLEKLIDIRQMANVVGGSHAQRDVIDLTLLAAAARAGEEAGPRAGPRAGGPQADRGRGDRAADRRELTLTGGRRRRAARGGRPRRPAAAGRATALTR